MKLTLIACVAALLLAACGPAGPQGSAPSPAASTTTVKLVDYAIRPSDLRVARGAALTVANAGKAPHNLYVSDASGHVLAHTPDLGPGQSARLVLDVTPGSYTIHCAEPGHEALGMTGTLRVT